MPGDQGGPRRPTQAYVVDIEAVCYPSTWWVLIAKINPHTRRPPDPLRVVEVLADWLLLGRERRSKCLRCMAWRPTEGEASRIYLPLGGTAGPEGSCSGCAYSYLDAVDQDGNEVRDLPEHYLAQEPPSYYRDLRVPRSERTRVEYWSRVGKRVVRNSELTGSDVEVVDRVRALRRAGRTPGEVAVTLNAEGYRTGTGHPWTAECVVEVGRRLA